MQVLQSVRTGISCDGKPVAAICLEDVAEHIPFSSSTFRDAVKSNRWGKHNVSKDFLPSTATTNVVIRRGHNSRARKCTVVWIEKLPENQQITISKGSNVKALNL
jgi:hypothetical protein